MSSAFVRLAFFIIFPAKTKRQGGVDGKKELQERRRVSPDLHQTVMARPGEFRRRSPHHPSPHLLREHRLL